MRYIKKCLDNTDSLRLSCFLLLVLACSQLAMAQAPVNISGSVVDRESRKAVPYVYIFTASQRTVTDEQGHFSVNIHPDDTVIFSAIGFDDYSFHLKKDQKLTHYEVVIEMDFKTYELQPVKVTAYQDLDQFKQSILDLKIPTKKNAEVNIPKLSYFSKTLPSADQSMGVGGSMRGPFSALYNTFSKEAKEVKKLGQYRQRVEADRSITAKYNLEVVKRVTNLNEKDAQRFVEWCRLENDFIQKSTEYELTVAMLKCLDEFPKIDSLR